MNEDEEETEWRTRDIYTPTHLFNGLLYKAEPEPTTRTGLKRTGISQRPSPHSALLPHLDAVQSANRASESNGPTSTS